MSSRRLVWPSDRSLAVAVGLLLTLGLVAAHVAYNRSAGGLWRDEVNSVNVAAVPSVADVLANMHFDSFPALWATVLHAWSAAGLGATDQGLRALGVSIGLGTIAVLWWTGWRLGIGPPLVALLLFGGSPSTIVYGDEVRGYGLAALVLVWAVGAMWALLRQPSRARFLVALAAAVVAAQAHYANDVLLAALGAGAAAVCLRRRDARLLLVVLGPGFMAALALLAINAGTLLYYTGSAGAIEQWVGSPVSVLEVFANALAPGVTLLAALWVLAAVLAALGFAWSCWSPRREDDRDRALFAIVALATGVVGTYLPYRWIGVPTQYWHYLSLIALVALAFEVGIDLLARRFRYGRLARAAAVALAALLVLPGVIEAVQVRMTSVDVVARRLERDVRPDDLVVVLPWYVGITFQRYYRGSAPWITIPDFEEHLFHRHLWVAEKMKQGSDAVAPDLARVEATLRGGGRVWIVGVAKVPDGGRPPHLPPAEEGSESWRAAPYLDAWELAFGALVESRTVARAPVPLGDLGSVNVWENPPLSVVEGWR